MRRTLLAVTLAALTATPALASDMDDAVIVWRNFQLVGPTDGARHDLHVYFVKQWWFTPHFGAFTFYGTQGTAAARVQWRQPLWASEDGETKLAFTGMGGYRAIGMGSSLANLSANLREGPEVDLRLSAVAGNWSALLQGSAAHLWGPSGASSGLLVFYGGQVGYKVVADTSVSFGILGAFLQPYANAMVFHDLGPTLTVSRRF